MVGDRENFVSKDLRSWRVIGRKKETEVLKDNWLHTGDIAVIDNDGFLKIVDRKKEMVLVSGFNVFPNEVENVISSTQKFWKLVLLEYRMKKQLKQ